MAKYKKQKGFTIIELLIATTIFSLILLIALGGIVQITKMYYAGVTRARTQNAARAVLDEVAETIRFSQANVVNAQVVTGPSINLGNGDSGFLCLGPKRYTYTIDRQRDSSLADAPPAPTTKHKKHVLWADQPTAGCGATAANLNVENPSSPEAANAVDGREFLSDRMRLFKFSIVDVTPAGGEPTYRVNVGVAYGDDDLLMVEGDGLACRTIFAGSEFCAISNLSVTVTRRL